MKKKHHEPPAFRTTLTFSYSKLNIEQMNCRSEHISCMDTAVSCSNSNNSVGLLVSKDN